MSGFIGKILRVNLDRLTVSAEELPGDIARRFLGGNGLATKYLFDEVPAGADPLGPENKLIYMTGPLTGTISPSSGRFAAVAKSPLSGLWGSSNSGGRFGLDIKRSGFDGIIVEGCAEEPSCLVVDDGQAQLLPASDLWGKEVSETTAILKKRLGKKINVSCIGPAGENLVKYAAIMNDVHRALGRCGLGAVMGSKNLKAICCGGSLKVPVADKEAFKAAAKTAGDFVNESLLKMTLEVYGTDMVLDLVNIKGGLPTNNWQSGSCDFSDEINGPAINEKILTGRKACFACPIACGRLSEVMGKYACKGEGPEYESVGAFGPMCGVSDLGAITKAHLRCNELGLDTVSAGGAIAWAMECFEKGILVPDDNNGSGLAFGDADALLEMVELIGARKGLGDILAEGSRIAAQRVGKDSSHFAMQVKGLELPSYDCRATKITGLGFAVANRGGDHITAYVQGPTFLDIPFLIVEESTIEDPLVENPKEAKVVMDLEDALTVFDAVGACKFMGMALMADDVTPVIAACTGWEDFNEAEFRKGGERIVNLARLFNVREGADRSDDTLPSRLLNEPLPDGPAAGQVVDLDPLLDAYYAFRGWSDNGKPTPAKLKELDLTEEAQAAGGA